MFDQLLKLVTDHSQNDIVNNPAIPNEQNDAAIQATTSGIFEQLKNQLSSGNADQLLDMFKGGNVKDHPATNEMMQAVQQKLSGMAGGQAGNIAQSLVPGILSKLIHKTNDPNDSSFDLQGIMKSLGGSGDLLDKVKGMMGGGGISSLLDNFAGKK